MPNKTTFANNSAWPNPIAASNPLVFPAVSQKTYPNSWVKKFLFDAGTDLSASNVSFELLPYNESSDEIFAGLPAEVLSGAFTSDAILDLPEAKTLFKAVFNVVAPLRLWLKPQIEVSASTDEGYAPISGKYFKYGSGSGQSAVYYKVGSNRLAKIQFNAEYQSWHILYDNNVIWLNLQDEENPTPDNPWEVVGGYWEPAESDPFLTVTQITY